MTLFRLAKFLLEVLECHRIKKVISRFCLHIQSQVEELGYRANTLVTTRYTLTMQTDFICLWSTVCYCRWAHLSHARWHQRLLTVTINGVLANIKVALLSAVVENSEQGIDPTTFLLRND